MPPPYKQINTPTPYATWAASKQLFPDGTMLSRTRAYEDPTDATMRIAYGNTQADDFWFLVRMTPDQEKEFWSIYAAWRDKQKGTHEFGAYARKPPTCGTPNTPTCPPDPPIAGAMEHLAELVAGPGATAAELDAARIKVGDLVIEMLESAARLLAP